MRSRIRVISEPGSGITGIRKSNFHSDYIGRKLIPVRNLSPTFHYVDKLGGEVRVELDFYFTTRPENGAVGVLSYDVRLYEGTSEDTTDLDGRVAGYYSYVGNIVDAKIDVISEEPGSADNASALFNVYISCYS